MQQARSTRTRAQMLSFRAALPQAAIYRAIAAGEGVTLSEWLRRAADRHARELLAAEATEL